MFIIVNVNNMNTNLIFHNDNNNNNNNNSLVHHKSEILRLTMLCVPVTYMYVIMSYI